VDGGYEIAFVSAALMGFVAAGLALAIREEHVTSRPTPLAAPASVLIAGPTTGRDAGALPVEVRRRGHGPEHLRDVPCPVGRDDLEHVSAQA